MNLDTRLRLLEARYAAARDAKRIRIVWLSVGSDLQVIGASVHTSDGTLRRFERLPTETREQLCARALSAAA